MQALAVHDALLLAAALRARAHDGAARGGLGVLALCGQALLAALELRSPPTNPNATRFSLSTRTLTALPGGSRQLMQQPSDPHVGCIRLRQPRNDHLEEAEGGFNFLNLCVCVCVCAVSSDTWVWGGWRQGER